MQHIPIESYGVRLTHHPYRLEGPTAADPKATYKATRVRELQLNGPLITSQARHQISVRFDATTGNEGYFVGNVVTTPDESLAINVSALREDFPLWYDVLRSEQPLWFWFEIAWGANLLMMGLTSIPPEKLPGPTEDFVMVPALTRVRIGAGAN